MRNTENVLTDFLSRSRVPSIKATCAENGVDLRLHGCAGLLPLGPIISAFIALLGDSERKPGIDWVGFVHGRFVSEGALAASLWPFSRIIVIIASFAFYWEETQQELHGMVLFVDGRPLTDFLAGLADRQRRLVNEPVLEMGTIPFPFARSFTAQPTLQP